MIHEPTPLPRLRDLVWYYTEAPAMLGERSAYPAMIAASWHGGEPSHEFIPVTDRMLGWGRHRDNGLIARERRIRRALIKLRAHDQAVLAAYYGHAVPVSPAAKVALGGALARVAIALSIEGRNRREVRSMARRAVERAHDAFEAAMRSAR